MKISIVAVLFLFTSVASAVWEKKEFSAQGLENLILKNTSGSVKVAVSQDEKAYVSIDKVKFGSHCTLKVNRTESDLKIKVGKTVGSNISNCEVNFEIKVPRAIAMELKNGSGNLEVFGTEGKIDFNLGAGEALINANISELEGRTGSGAINITGSIEKAAVRSGSGNIEIVGLAGNADLRTGSGDLILTYKNPPQKGALKVKTGSGNVTAYFPPTMKVLTKFVGGSGKMDNQLGNTSGAPFKVSVKTGSGNFKVRKL